MYPEFARLLNQYLNEHGRSSAWLARQLHMSSSTISIWRNDGERPGNSSVVLRIAEILELGKEQRYTFLEAAGYIVKEQQDDSAESNHPQRERTNVQPDSSPGSASPKVKIGKVSIKDGDFVVGTKIVKGDEIHGEKHDRESTRR